MANLDHERGKHAAQRVLQERFSEAEFENHREETKKKLKNYRSVVMGAGTYIRQAGLLQLAAFWLGKRDVEREVLEDVLLWLQESRVTGAICSRRNGCPTNASPASLEWLLGCSAQEVVLLEAEAERYLGWLKRVTEGLWKECDGGNNGP